jgi:hypothetical protein
MDHICVHLHVALSDPLWSRLPSLSSACYTASNFQHHALALKNALPLVSLDLSICGTIRGLIFIVEKLSKLTSICGNLRQGPSPRQAESSVLDFNSHIILLHKSCYNHHQYCTGHSHRMHNCFHHIAAARWSVLSILAQRRDQ